MNPETEIKKLNKEIEDISIVMGSLATVQSKVNMPRLKNIENYLNERPEVQKVSLEGISVITLKGDQGEKGDEPSDERLEDLILPLIPKPIKGDDGQDYILTEKDKKDIAKSIKVPVVEKVIEKIEVIIKEPIVTNEIKEIAISETAEEIANKLESLKDEARLDVKAIKGIDKILEVFRGSLIPMVSSGVKTLQGLFDTNISNPTNGQALVYNTVTQKWENKNVSGGGSTTLQTNGVNNTVQNLLNLKAGTNMTLTPDGLGGVVFESLGGGGVTNLGYTPSPTNGIVTSDTGTDATIPLANGTNAGLTLNDYSTAEKNKLGFVTVTQAVNLDTIESNSDASKVKTDFITITQPVNLDTLESDTVINNAKISNVAHTGDATGATALTLATVNSNVGSFGLAGSIAQFVVNAKGLITSAVNVAIFITASQVSDFTSAVNALITGKQNTVSLTTTGTSGASTFNSSTGALNIPNYAGGGGGGNNAERFIDSTAGVSAYTRLIGEVDGVNGIFTVSQGSYLTGKLLVYVNGNLQDDGAFSGTYRELNPSIGTFQFNTIPVAFSIITVEYNTTSPHTSLLSWDFLVSNWSTEPTSVNILNGEAFTYTLLGTTRYRFVPTIYNPTQDAFYANFDGTTLTNLITTRG